MSEEKKTVEEQEPSKEQEPTTDETSTADETSTTEEPDRLKEATEYLSEKSEKLWGTTKSAWNTAAFKANQYKLIVQKKIDLAALHKKISAAHSELGKLIDDLHTQGQKSIMATAGVKSMLETIDNLKASAAELEEEIENLQVTEHPEETDQQS